MQYIGQTNQKVSRRTNSHSFGINANDGQGYATYVALYFNTDFHSLDDFRFVMYHRLHKVFSKFNFWI